MDKQQRHKLIIEHLVNGFSSAETAQETGISFATVNSDIAQLKTKYGAKNSPHLVHILHEQGYFTPIVDE